MGRPPLNFLETKVRLSAETRARIVGLVGNYQIAAFIREAIENELARREAVDEKIDAEPQKPSQK